MSVREDGPTEGPPLVLCNSLGTSLAMWDENVSALAARRRLLRYDMRGHDGAAPVPSGPYSIDELGGEVLELLDARGVVSAAICGVSLGGIVGLWLAINAPERVEKLVVVCSAPQLGNPDMWRQRAEAVRRDGGLAGISQAIVGRWFAAGDPERVAAAREMLEAVPAEGYAGCCEALAELDLSAGVATIEAPTLVIAGDEDPVIKPAEVEAWTQKLPNGRFVALESAAHLANIEQAAIFNRYLLSHFEEGV